MTVHILCLIIIIYISITADIYGEHIQNAEHLHHVNSRLNKMCLDDDTWIKIFSDTFSEYTVWLVICSTHMMSKKFFAISRLLV